MHPFSLLYTKSFIQVNNFAFLCTFVSRFYIDTNTSLHYNKVIKKCMGGFLCLKILNILTDFLQDTQI